MRKEVEELNEIFLWKKVKSGDTESFSQVFKFYYPSLFIYGVKLVGLPDFVRDQIQELFINIWETRQNLGDVKNLKAYLFISLRRRLFSFQKLNLKLNFVEDLPEAAHRSLIFEDREFVDREFISANLKAILIRNLNDLPSNQREIIFLKFFHRLTYKEIAQIINVKEQSVKNIMPKILKKLATGLTDISKEDINDVDILLFNLFLLFRVK
jgi:RNA polymerase sigma-70 factor (ECF subfamily)